MMRTIVLDRRSLICLANTRPERWPVRGFLEKPGVHIKNSTRQPADMGPYEIGSTCAVVNKDGEDTGFRVAIVDAVFQKRRRVCAWERKTKPQSRRRWCRWLADKGISLNEKVWWLAFMRLPDKGGE